MAVITPTPRIGKTTGAMAKPAGKVHRPSKRKPLAPSTLRPAPMPRGLINR